MTPVKRIELGVRQADLCKMKFLYNNHRHALKSKRTEIEELELKRQLLIEEAARVRLKTGSATQHAEKQIVVADEIATVTVVNGKMTDYSAKLDHILQRYERSNAEHECAYDTRSEQLGEQLKEQEHAEECVRERKNAVAVVQCQWRAASAAAAKRRKGWSQRLASRQQQVEDALEVMNLRQEQDLKRLQILAEAKGDLSLKEESALRQNNVAKKLMEIKAEGDVNSRHQELGRQEEAFARIRKKTGISDGRELIERFLNFKQESEKLKRMTAEAQQRCVELEQSEVAIKAELHEIKVSGLVHLNKQRRVLDEKEAITREINQVISRADLRHAYLRTIISHAQTGITHLRELVSVAQLPALFKKLQSAEPLVFNVDSPSLASTLTACNASIRRAMDELLGHEIDLDFR